MENRFERMMNSSRVMNTGTNNIIELKTLDGLVHIVFINESHFTKDESVPNWALRGVFSSYELAREYIETSDEVGVYNIVSKEVRTELDSEVSNDSDHVRVMKSIHNSDSEVY